MSKKTRKKSSRTPARTTPATAAKRSGTAASRVAAKPSTGKSSNKPAKASHGAKSKTLKAAAAKKPAAATGKKVTAAGRAAANPLVKKRQAPGGDLPLTDGARAPAFTLPADSGNNVSLGDYAGRKLVIFFYPRADTPGCTREAIDFTRLSDAFAEAETAVLGVSADPMTAQTRFRDRHQLAMTLASDEKHDMLQSYGVWGEKSMYGKTFYGILRTTVLIDRDGEIARIWRHVKVDGHADEVLAAAQAL